MLKSGSRGKIQLRWRQGRMASSDSHCQMVEPEMLATRPRLMTSAWMSGTWRRESGSPSCAGSSHAIALTAMTNSGGKKPAPAGPVALLQALQALLEEPFAPFADDLAAGVEALGDLVVAQAAGSEKHQVGAEHIAIRQRIFSSSCFQDATFITTQGDLVGARARQREPYSDRDQYVRLIYVIVIAAASTKDSGRPHSRREDPASRHRWERQIKSAHAI